MKSGNGATKTKSGANDLWQALTRVIRITQGDYSPDNYRERFPNFVGLDSGQTPQQLFEAWVVERRPARSSIESWRYVFAEMVRYFKDRSAGSITPDEAQDWIRVVNFRKRTLSDRTVWRFPP